MVVARALQPAAALLDFEGRLRVRMNSEWPATVGMVAFVSARPVSRCWIPGWPCDRAGVRSLPIRAWLAVVSGPARACCPARPDYGEISPYAVDGTAGELERGKVGRERRDEPR
jgi:hypothetical protein